MASKLKHAQRSHKTYGRKGDIYRGFERQAYVKAGFKSYSNNGLTNSTLLTLLAGGFRRLFNRKSK